MSASSDGYWRRLAAALKKPLIGVVFIILFIITLAFSAIPVIVPLLGIDFFGFGEVEMSYFFMYIGVVQIVLQGILIGRLTKRWGEENLIVLGSLLMMLGIFTMPLVPNIIVFLSSITIMSSGIGILNTVLSSFISKRTTADEQGGMLGVAQSVGSIARIPGPLIGGLIAEIAGLNIAFFISAGLLMIAFGLGFKVFQAHRFRGRSAEAIGP
jgi:DHA1 family tetracycline resistance protein-like MFS transporter